jgi:hypothetical protein
MKKITVIVLCAATLVLAACSGNETIPTSECSVGVAEMTTTAESSGFTTSAVYTTLDPVTTIVGVTVSPCELDVSRTAPTTACPPTDVFEPDMTVVWESEGEQAVFFRSLHGFVNMFERGRSNIVSDDGLYRLDESIVNYDNIFLPLPMDNFMLGNIGMRCVFLGRSPEGEQLYGSELSFGIFRNDLTMNFILVEVQGDFRDLNERLKWYEQLVEQGNIGGTQKIREGVLIRYNDFREASAEFWYDGKIYSILMFSFFDTNGDWDGQRQITEQELLDLARQIRFVSWDNRTVALEAERAVAMAAS